MASIVFLSVIKKNILENIVYLDDSRASIYVDNEPGWIDSIDTLKDISKLNNLTDLKLHINMDDVTIQRMNFTNPNIVNLTIHVTCNAICDPLLLYGIECMPSLKSLTIDCEMEEEDLLVLNIGEHLKHNTYLKYIQIDGCTLHPNTKEELKNYCRSNNIIITYTPDKYN